MSAAFAWVALSSFVLGVIAGGLLASALIVSVRLTIARGEKKRAEEVLRRRYRFPVVGE